MRHSRGPLSAGRRKATQSRPHHSEQAKAATASTRKTAALSLSSSIVASGVRKSSRPEHAAASHQSGPVHGGDPRDIETGPYACRAEVHAGRFSGAEPARGGAAGRSTAHADEGDAAAEPASSSRTAGPRALIAAARPLTRS